MQSDAIPIPIGIASLSAFLKREGHTTDLFDTTFFDTARDYEGILRMCKNKIKIFQPDLLCVSCRSNEYPFVLKILGSLKEIEVPIIIGGPHPTVDSLNTINSELVDMICIGEGEEALSELVDNMEKGEEVTNIKNIWVKKHQKIYRNDVRRPIEDLDDLPYPDWGIFDERHLLNSHVAKKGKMARIGSFELSRGCPYQCTYCVNPYLQKLYAEKGKYHRVKSVGRSIEEIAYFKTKYDLEVVYLVDETFLVDRERIGRFCRGYKKRIDLPFTIMTRAETITKEKLERVRDAGCCMVSVGIESGNEELRKNVLNRHMTQTQIIRAFKLIKEVGLIAYSFNMVGLPYEDRSKIFETIDLNRKAKPDQIQVTIFYPFEGTKLKEVCLEEKFIPPDNPLLENYYTKSTLTMPQLSSSEIEALHRTFKIYVRSPKILYPLIKILEKNNVAFRVLCSYLGSSLDAVSFRHLLEINGNFLKSLTSDLTSKINR